MADDTFDAGWLRLREPVDHRSRAVDLEVRLSRFGETAGWSRVVDLGSGTGSNVRHLAPRLPWAETWRVVDHDPDLLGRIRAPAGRHLERVVADLATDEMESIEGADLVTGSALLDLVSERWIERLARQCARSSGGVLFALSVDGTVQWPGSNDPDDEWISDAFRRHQARDKGFGGALGARAAPVARDLLERAGMTVWLRPSPWILTGRDDSTLAREWLAGWAAAVVEIHPDRRSAIEAWLARRMSAIGRGEYRLEVGHLDLLALPPGRKE